MWLLLAALPAVVWAGDGIDLTVAKNPAPDQFDLTWTGSQPLFEVYGSDDPSVVLDPASKLGETTSRVYLDVAPPDVFFYQVVRQPNPVATVTDGAEDRILLLGTVLGPSGPFEGEVLVEQELITCVAASCSAEPGASGATVVDTNGIILPGIIDAHNHGLFNIFDEDDWNPTVFYGDHNDWTSDQRYGEVVDAKQYLGGQNGSPVDYRCEMDKYAEAKALIAATTSFLAAPGTSLSCYASVVRTIDTSQNDLGFDKIQTSISVPSESTAQSICNNFASGNTDAYVVHVGEGINQTALNEFASLASRAGGCLLSPKTTIVHGTAFGTPEFTTMATNGMALVWSPRSNMDLYDATARIDLAIQAGVSVIAIAPDWGLNGSINMLDELRYADQIDAAKFGDILSPQRLFEMVTIDAARALALDGVIGSLEVGKRADLAVIDGWRPAPYEALLLAHPEQVRLVLVDGRALYGDDQLVAVGPAAPGCEIVDVCANSKFMCIEESSTANKLDQTYAVIRQELVTALSDYDVVVGPSIDPFSPIAPLLACAGGPVCAGATANIDSVLPGTTVPSATLMTFNGSGSGEGTLTLDWDFDWDGTAGNFNIDGTGSSVQYTPADGTWLVGLRVTDSCGSPGPQTAFASVSITVGGSTCAPTSASIDSVLPGTSVPSGTLMTFNGSGAGEGTLILDWDFDWDGVPGNFNIDDTGTSVSYSPPDGSWLVGLRVTDSCADPSPQTAYDTVSISVGVSCGPQVVISQVYGGGGNSGAYWRQDYIEIFNRGDAAQDLSGWSVQYASSTGSSWSITPLSGSIPAGGYYLIQQATGSGGTADIPTPDVVGSTAMSATSGKVALVDTTTALSGTCPASAGIQDLVGYGSASCWEGSGAAPGLSNTETDVRASDGCTDTDDNSADFGKVTADTSYPPRNSSSPVNLCGCP